MKNSDVIKAFQNKQEQTVPFSVWHHFTPDQHLEATSKDEISEKLEKDIKGEQNYIHTFQPDFIKLMDDGFFTYPLRNVANPVDLKNLEKVQPLNSNDRWLKNQYRVTAGQLKDIDPHKLTFGNIFSPITLLKWKLVGNRPLSELGTGNKVFTDLYLKNPRIMIKALKVVNQDVKKQIQAQAKAGVHGIYYSTQEIQDSRLGKSFFDHVQKPIDMDVINYINHNFKIGILHICGNAGAHNHIPWFSNYQLPVVNWSTDTDGYSLKEGKKLFHNKVVLGGLGITTKDVLYRGNKDDIQKAVDQLLDGAGTQGVILGADCTIPRDTPQQHIKWAEDATHTYVSRKK